VSEGKGGGPLGARKIFSEKTVLKIKKRPFIGNSKGFFARNRAGGNRGTFKDT